MNNNVDAQVSGGSWNHRAAIPRAIAAPPQAHPQCNLLCGPNWQHILGLIDVGGLCSMGGDSEDTGLVGNQHSSTFIEASSLASYMGATLYMFHKHIIILLCQEYY
ncbi:hypothetical protein SAY86_000001 [Trapa natans]|uniref:Uncharacterized protein n=1 Tax=Trapa natans TaxID=22666 RepID=A0AAN7RMG5_TRANT|nr:hypothetical protein SAY86_000001 [Trapa natans]